MKLATKTNKITARSREPNPPPHTEPPPDHPGSGAVEEFVLIVGIQNKLMSTCAPEHLGIEAVERDRKVKK